MALFVKLLNGDAFAAFTTGSLLNDSQPALPINGWWPFLYSSIVLLFCLLVCLIGASMFARTSFLIFLVVMATLITVFVSFFVKEPDSIPFPRNNELSPNGSANYTGFHYADFAFDGRSLVQVVRSGYRGANSYHNANHAFAQRVDDYRRACGTEHLYPPVAVV